MRLVIICLSFLIGQSCGDGRANLGVLLDWSVFGHDVGSVQARVPGGIYSDLRRAGVLPDDIYYRFAELEYRWVARANWTYTATLELSDLGVDVRRYPHVYLDFEGLDTVADIEVDGERVAQTSNMFVRHRVPLNPGALPDSVQLKVVFRSPIEYAAERFQNHVAETGYDVKPDCQFSVCHANHVRKMQSSFGWDWGPGFPSMGIWKDVSLAWTAMPFRIKAFTWDPVLETDHWVVQMSVAIDLFDQDVDSIPALTVELEGVTEASFKDVPVVGGSARIKLTVNVADVDLWWPNGHGEQKLYDVKVTAGHQATHQTTQLSRSVGFRTVNLVENTLKSGGLTFYIEINGKPVFAKGSNWIPAHVLPEEATNDYVTDLLTSAKDANMNMLRVWGGGIYESDTFYHLADQLGIMLWQDFMFACSMYSALPWDLENVRVEVGHQFTRIQHHPSVVIWAGNNENEAALTGNWYGTNNSHFSDYKRDYLSLYVDTIRSELETFHQGTNFVVKKSYSYYYHTKPLTTTPLDFLQK